MKRAFPQKVKSAHTCVPASGSTSGRTKQTPPEVKRRARTSAAVIGLAISMGSQGLILPRQGDGAMAAEPVVPESTVTATPKPIELAALTSGNEVQPTATRSFLPEATIVEHTVQEGQTLWHLAQIYRIEPTLIASANGVGVDTVLRVGQTLRIPSEFQMASVERADRVTPVSELSNGVVSPSIAPSPVTLDANGALKQSQDESLDRLRQKRDQLKAGLSELNAPVAAPEPVAAASPAPEQAPEAAVSAEPAKIAYQPSVPTVSPNFNAPVVKPQVERPTYANYQVRKGDTLDSIARRYKVSRTELVRLNRLSDPNFILVNQTLKLPQRAPQPEPQMAVIPSLPTSDPSAVTVASSVPTVPILSGLAVPAAAQQPLVPGLVPSTEAPKPEVELSIDGGNSTQPEYQAGVMTLPAELPAIAEVSDEAASSEVQVAAVAPAGESVAPTPEVSVGESARNPYVESLLSEIAELRQKYQSDAATATAPEVESEVEVVEVAPVAVPSQTGATKVPASGGSLPVSARQINPEFSPKRHSEILRQEMGNSQQVSAMIQPSAAAEKPAAPAADRQLVAAAPLGSESYAPLLQPTVGQMVSPDLPPIGEASAYLPDAAARFKGYIWPARGVLTSGYGWRWGRMHKGIDIAAPIGTPVVAAAPGVVVTAGWNSGGYGNLVEIRHPDGSLTLYAHNNRILVKVGQSVDQGQQIAEMGSTGYSTGPHSHFEVHIPGQGAVNPVAHLPRSRNDS